MSYYRQGLHVASKSTALEKQSYRNGVAVGAFIATPGYIKDQVNNLDADIQGTADEVQAACLEHVHKVDGSNILLGMDDLGRWYITTWLPFLKQWHSFHDDHQSWYDNMWGSTIDTLNSYRQKLIDLRKTFRNVGGSLQSPEPQPPDVGWIAELGRAVEGVGHLLKNVVYVLIAMVGGFMLYKMYITVRSPA